MAKKDDNTEPKAKTPKRSIMDMQERSLIDLENTDYDFNVSTGSLIFDIFLDGGFRAGISRFSAPSEQGKSSQGLTFSKNWLDFHKEKARVIFFDAEGRLTWRKIKNIGVHKSKWFRSVNLPDGTPDPNNTFRVYKWNEYEDIAQRMYDLILNNGKDGKPEYRYFFMIDSLDMLITRDGNQKSFGETEKIAGAQGISTILTKKLAPYLEDRGHHLYICSQIRANLDMANPNSPKTRVSGGFAIIHSSSMTGEVQKNWSDTYIYENPNGKSLKEKGDVIGHYHTIKFTKTFNEKTHRTIQIPIKYGRGVWVEREIADLAIQYEIVKKSGAWFDMEEGFANELDKNINAFVAEKRTQEYIDDAIVKAASEGKSYTEKQIQKVRETKYEEILNSLPEFKVERKWQGSNNFYDYLEGSPDLVSFLYDKFKKTLVVTGQRVEEDDEPGKGQDKE